MITRSPVMRRWMTRTRPRSRRTRTYFPRRSIPWTVRPRRARGKRAGRGGRGRYGARVWTSGSSGTARPRLRPVDRDDALGQIPAGGVNEARLPEESKHGRLIQPVPHGNGQVPVGVGMTRDQAPQSREQREGVQVVERAEHRIGHPSELQDGQAAAWAEHAVDLPQGRGRVGDVAQPKGHRDGIERRRSERQAHGVADEKGAARRARGAVAGARSGLLRRVWGPWAGCAPPPPPHPIHPPPPPPPPPPRGNSAAPGPHPVGKRLPMDPGKPETKRHQRVTGARKGSGDCPRRPAAGRGSGAGESVGRSGHRPPAPKPRKGRSFKTRKETSPATETGRGFIRQ